MAAKFILATALALPAICTASALPQSAAVSEFGVAIGDGEKIVGGEAALPGEFPYIVSLSSGGFHRCGGSLLDSLTVLTAAHCSFIEPSQSQVRGGTLTWETGGIQVDVASITIHPQYTTFSQGFDVAIWKLASPIEGEGIGYATLPPAGYIPPTGELVTTAGWGDLESGAGAGSPILMKVEVPVVDRAVCEQQYPGQITDTMFCAAEAEGGQDSCQGDSGGPITLADGTVIGLVSWGRGCALPDFAGVYANVGTLRDFIDANI